MPRRDFLRACAAALAAAPVLENRSLMGQPVFPTNGPSRWVASLNRNWLFAGRLDPENNFDESAAAQITLPHCVTQLSWQKWDPSAWEDVWGYRRHFDLPAEFKGLRVFLRFDRVMAAAAAELNGHTRASPEPRHATSQTWSRKAHWCAKANAATPVIA